MGGITMENDVGSGMMEQEAGLFLEAVDGLAGIVGSVSDVLEVPWEDS